MLSCHMPYLLFSEGPPEFIMVKICHYIVLYKIDNVDKMLIRFAIILCNLSVLTDMHNNFLEQLA